MIVVPVIGSTGWGEVLNTALTELDSMVSDSATAAEAAAVAAAAAEAGAAAAAAGAAAAQAGADAAAEAAEAAQTTADGKNRIYRQASAPTGGTYTDGDLWFDTDDGNRPYVRVSGAWVDAQDAAIAAALATGTAAQTTADGKNAIYRQASPPAGGNPNDLWFDTDDGFKPYVRSGGSWVSAQDAAIAAAQSTAVAAQTTADGKNRIFIQSTTPTATATNDTWIDTGSGNSIKGWTGSAWTVRELGSDAIAANAITASEILAGAVVAGKIATDAVTSNTIAANAVVAGKIATNAVTAGTIDAGSITSGKIAAGAVTANAIEALAVTAEKLAANSVIAAKIDAGAVTAGKLAADSVLANNIKAGEITTAHITAAGISADKITTGTLNASLVTVANINASNIVSGTMSGARITAGTITADKLDVDALTAKNFYSSASGSRIIIGPAAVFSGDPRVTFDRTGSGAEETDPYIGIEPSSNYLFISGGSSLANSGTTFLTMGDPGTINEIAMGAVSNDGTQQGECRVRAGSVSTSVRLEVTGQISNTGVIVSTGVRDTTTSGGSNININTVNGEFRRSTASSARYKKFISTLGAGSAPELAPEALYALPVRQFQYKASYLSADDQFAGRYVPGLIAEEVAEHYPAAVELAAGEPENWNPRHLVPAMLALIQSHHQRLTALEDTPHGPLPIGPAAPAGVRDRGAD